MQATFIGIVTLFIGFVSTSFCAPCAEAIRIFQLPNVEVHIVSLASTPDPRIPLTTVTLELRYSTSKTSRYGLTISRGRYSATGDYILRLDPTSDRITRSIRIKNSDSCFYIGLDQYSHDEIGTEVQCIKVSLPNTIEIVP